MPALPMPEESPPIRRRWPTNVASYGRSDGVARPATAPGRSRASIEIALSAAIADVGRPNAKAARPTEALRNLRRPDSIATRSWQRRGEVRLAHQVQVDAARRG